MQLEVPSEQASLWGGPGAGSLRRVWVWVGPQLQASPLHRPGPRSLRVSPPPAFYTPSGLVTVSSFVLRLTSRTSVYTGSRPGLPPDGREVFPINPTILMSPLQLLND